VVPPSLDATTLVSPTLSSAPKKLWPRGHTPRASLQSCPLTVPSASYGHGPFGIAGRKGHKPRRSPVHPRGDPRQPHTFPDTNRPNPRHHTAYCPPTMSSPGAVHVEPPGCFRQTLARKDRATPQSRPPLRRPHPTPTPTEPRPRASWSRAESWAERTGAPPQTRGSRGDQPPIRRLRGGDKGALLVRLSCQGVPGRSWRVPRR
jgi:hypothetical protein